MTKPKILIIADDKNICKELEFYLRQDGCRVVSAHDGKTGLELFRSKKPNIVILDLMLPETDGRQVLQAIRKESEVPVIMLTAPDACEDKVTGLGQGVGDYVAKPFDPREVSARVKDRLRKQKSETEDASEVLVVGNIVLDCKKHEVTCEGEKVALTPKEFQLLEYMIKNKNMVLSREQILREVWEYDYIGETRTIDMHINKLRHKLNSSDTWTIKTVYGKGYKFEVYR
ncbi:MAG TPA: response regulator transcription factor [Syntrophaceticus sp.]|nr:response regulator transcription factor [Syntrophaceticus sp.]